MYLVVLFNQPFNHTLIITCYLWQALTVEKQETAVTVNHDWLCFPAVLANASKRLINLVAHGKLAYTAVCFSRFSVVPDFCISQKLVVYID